MIVSMWMVRDVVTVRPEMPLNEVAALMAEKRIRRVLVTEPGQAGERLVGLVSAKDILHAFPSDVNPFAVIAARSGAAPGNAGQVMARDLQTTTPDAPIEQAAAVMAEKKVGALPVLRDGKLAGIITESDIFRAFVSIFPTLQGGARVTFDVSAGENIFDYICGEAARRKLRVLSLTTSEQDGLPVCVVRVTGAATERFLEDLWSSGHRVLNVIRF
ncbi:MAG TPA: CBS domain-containing protein [Verrucomicrobiae bacterium]|nr:CBS domain-containing protein [Verrucomicrobiae bacterium]